MKTSPTLYKGASSFGVQRWPFDPVLTLLLLLVTGAGDASAAVRYVDASSASPTPPYTNWATAACVIQDAVDAAVAGDEIVVTNGTYATGGRTVGTNLLVNRVAVDKPLVLRSVNGAAVTQIVGYQVPGTTNGPAAVRCVYLADGASLSGFTLTNGATLGATGTNADGTWSISQSGGGVWCEAASVVVSNCTLIGNSAFNEGGGAFGGTLNNCALTGNSAYVNGGGGSAEGTLNDCSLTDNSAAWRGGGASWSTLDNCALTGNSAEYAGGVCFSALHNCTLSGNSAWGKGGGAVFSTLNNCTLSGNSAVQSGGGAFGGVLNNCTVTSNSASWGGGVCLDYVEGPSGLWLSNCIVYFNSAMDRANYNERDLVALNYCCTAPMPTNGVGNITNAPLFVDYAHGNLRLRTNSPCTNAGNNSYLTNSYFTNCMDLDGNPRIVSGTVDIGAYEFQGSGSVIAYAWLQRYGLPTDGSADLADPDADGHNNWQEWRCQTDPTNALSALRLLSATPDGTNVTVTWESVAGVSYFLERSTNLSASPPFTLLAPNLPGQSGTTSFTDTNAASLAPLFYRVRVGE